MAQAVAGATDRLDQFDRMAFIDFFAKMANIDIDDIREALETLIPNMFHDHCPGKHTPGVGQKIFQERIFLGTQADPLACASDLLGQSVQLEVPSP